MNDTLYLHGLVGGVQGEWVRPPDWMGMPASIANSVDILAAVFNHESNYCSVKISTSTGTYTVDWGDGTVDAAVTSNTQIDHLYSYSDADLGPVSTRGYKQALIRITPNTGNITAVNLNVKHARSGLANGTTAPWLDVTINASSATTISFYSSASFSTLLERVNIVAMGAVTNGMSSAFFNCYSLQSVTFPAGSLASVTSAAYMFNGCNSLRSVTFPAGSLASVTVATSMFNSCYSLRSVTFPAGSLASVTSVANMFTACYSLQSVTFPAGSLAGVTDANRVFQQCFALQTVSFPAGALSLVGDATQIFWQCFSLESIDLPSGALSAITTSTNMFATCPALANITNLSIPITFSVSGAKLSGEALDRIYTSLPTVTAKTITVTGNHGIASHTPSIATAKGWTVTT